MLKIIDSKSKPPYLANRLEKYALWYYNRYYPSVSVLRQKLISKNPDIKTVEDVLMKISPYFMEEYLLESKIQDLITKCKSDRYIKDKLLLKWFKEKQIKDRLIYLRPETNINEEFLKRKIESSIHKKSIKSISCSMLVSWYDSDALKKAISDIKLSDKVSLEKELSKLLNKELSKEKIISKLVMKGYKYDDIKNLLSKK